MQNKNSEITPEVKAWIDKAEPSLKRYGKKIVDDYSPNKIMKWTLVLIALFVLGFLYLGHGGYFKSDIYTNVTNSCPVCPSCPSCPGAPVCPSCTCPEVNLTCYPAKIYVNGS